MKGHTRISLANGNDLFFTADLHLFHDKIIKYCNRPFGNCDEMNKKLIDNWNSVVPADGKVFVLGDMFWKRRKDGVDLKSIMQALNGKKWLVSGNHDLLKQGEYLEIGFELAQEYLELAVDKQLLVLSHFPMLRWNCFCHGAWHLYGHCHGGLPQFHSCAMDVGVDCHNYFPFSWQQIVEKMPAQEISENL